MDRTINEQKQQYQNDIEKYKKSIGKQEKEIYELKQSEKQKE